MKVSKEDVIGVLTAVEYWLKERDETAEHPGVMGADEYDLSAAATGIVNAVALLVILISSLSLVGYVLTRLPADAGG